MKEGRKQARPEPSPSLYQRASQGDREAWEQLVEYHRPWVEKIARSLSSRLPNLGCCEEQDLVNDAWEGFSKALRGYNPHRGIPFKAYAKRVIRGAIIAGAARCLGLSEAARRLFPHVFDALEKLMQKGVSNPTPAQIQEELRKKGLHKKNLSISTRVILEILNGVRHVPLPPGREGDSNSDGIEEEPWDPRKKPRDKETILETLDWIRDRLGAEKGRKFVALAILHEGLGLGWDEIAHLLSSGSPSGWAKGWVDWAKEWAIRIQADWSSALPCFPGLDDWEEVRRCFLHPPPQLNATNLRRWYSRHRRGLRHKTL